MHRNKPISEAHEMYLKAVYQVRDEDDVARVRDLADNLGVSPATVSTVMKKLERQRLVDHERYGRVALTEAGARVAECVIERFETVQAVLVEVFGVDPRVAEVDACQMEHAVSPMTVRRMKHLLNSVRSGKTQLPRRPARRKDDPCTECEETGVCQAAVRE
jgi:DtxR family Mn-dependent transcriptional regulator